MSARPSLPEFWRTFAELPLGASVVVAAQLTLLTVAFCFGGVEPWAQSLALIGTGLAFTLLSIRLMTDEGQRHRRDSLGNAVVVLAAGLLVIVGAAICLQIYAPHHWLAPHPSWALLRQSGLEPASGAGAVTLAPQLSLRGLIWLLLYAALFIIAFLAGRSQRLARLCLYAFLAVEAVIALYGLVNYATGNELVAFVQRTTQMDALTASFVNRNSYATFVGLALVASVAQLLDGVAAAPRQRSEDESRIKPVLTYLFGRGMVLCVAVILFLAVLVFTQSRAGMASTAAALFVLVLLYLTRTRRMPFIWLAAQIVIAVLVSVAAYQLAGDRVFDRFAGGNMELSLSNRLDIYAAAMDLMNHTGLLGSGYGTFQYAFYPYISRDLVSVSSYFDAHNSYIEAIVELGWIVGPCLIALPLVLAIGCLRAFASRSRHLGYPAAAVAASVLVGMHALFDFSVEIPAVAMAFAWLLGVGISQPVEGAGRRR